MDLITDIFNIIEILYPGINVRLVEDGYTDNWVRRLGYRMKLVASSTIDPSYFSEVVIYKYGYTYSRGRYYNCQTENQRLNI